MCEWFSGAAEPSGETKETQADSQRAGVGLCRVSVLLTRGPLKNKKCKEGTRTQEGGQGEAQDDDD